MGFVDNRRKYSRLQPSLSLNRRQLMEDKRKAAKDCNNFNVVISVWFWTHKSVPGVFSIQKNIIWISVDSSY